MPTWPRCLKMSKVKKLPNQLYHSLSSIPYSSCTLSNSNFLEADPGSKQSNLFG